MTRFKLSLIAALVTMTAITAAIWLPMRLDDPVPSDPRQVRETLFQLLQPLALANCELERFGEENDGGYILCGNLLGDVQSAYSYGISGYDGWGCEVSTQLKVRTHQYDCFDVRLPKPCPTGDTEFHPECVAATSFTESGRIFDSMEGQFAKNGDARKRLVVKMDIEGAEWDSLLEASDETLDQIDQLAIEMHYVEDPKFVRVVQRLNQWFHVAHLHFNNYSCRRGLDPFPAWAYEVLFVNKRLTTVTANAPPSRPTPVDTPNNPKAPDCQTAGPHRQTPEPQGSRPVALTADSSTTSAAPLPGPGDVAVFQTIVTDMRSGASYYETYGDVLRRYGYPLSHPFNWRTPLLMSSLSVLSERAVITLWIGIALALCTLTLVILARAQLPPVAFLTAMFMQCGAVFTAPFAAAIVLGEAWAGALIGLSICAYLSRWPSLGICFGLLALFVRELAGPYCLVCATLAGVGGRRREVMAWLFGGVLYGLYYGMHLTNVWEYQLPTDLSHTRPWTQFAGLTFLTAAVRWHLVSQLASPEWAALALLAIVASILSSSSPVLMRWSAATYIGLFMTTGQSFNQYWGLLTWPMWALNTGYGLAAIADWVRALLGRRKRTPTPVDDSATRTARTE